MDCRYFSILGDHDFFDEDIFSNLPKKSSIFYLSVDPGKENLAIRVEERFLQDDSWKVIFFEKITLNGGQNNFINNLQRLLCHERLHENKLDVVLIESQAMINHTNVAIHSHIRSFFLSLSFFNNKDLLVIDLSPSLKGHAFNLDKKHLKILSYERALSRFHEKDEESHHKILSYAKGDDLADTFNMIEAFHKVYVTQEITLIKKFQKKNFLKKKNSQKINNKLSFKKKEKS